jgi:hypothetical protein
MRTITLRKTVVAALLLNVLTPSVWASSPGTTGAEVLKIGVGARAIAMGEAYTAQADDVSSLYWNPAGLALMQERQASFMYDQMYRDLSYSNLAIGFPLENGAIGASLSYLGYGSIAGYDPNGDPIGDQSAHSAVGTVGAAWLGNQWSAGINLKGIQENLADDKANAFAFDAGVNLIYPKPVLGGTMRLGLVAQNLGSGIKHIEQEDDLPTAYKVGLAAVQLMNRKLNLSFDYNMPKEEDGIFSTGAEYWLNRYLALRAGYVNSEREGNGARAGIGLRIRGVSFDYAYAGQGELGMSHRYEMSFRFGEPRPLLSPEQRKIYEQAKAAARNEQYERSVLLFDSLLETEPRFNPARRRLKTVMAKLEGQQSHMASRQGRSYNPATASGAKKPALPEMDDLEQLLNLGTPKAAQTGDTNKGGN